MSSSFIFTNPPEDEKQTKKLEYNIRTAVHNTQPTQTATQPHTSPVNSQQVNHGTSPHVLGPLLPGVPAEANIV